MMEVVTSHSQSKAEMPVTQRASLWADWSSTSYGEREDWGKCISNAKSLEELIGT